MSADAPGEDIGAGIYSEIDIPQVQLLDEGGTLRSDGQFSRYIEALSVDELRQMYRDMAIARRIDTEATALQRHGELALWVPLRGQEAAQVGAARGSQPQDYLVPTYREHAVALVRNVSLGDLLSLFRGTAHSGWDPREHNFHVYTLVLAAQTLHAVGYAMGISKDAQRGLVDESNPEAVMAFFGDGSSSEGDVHESMVFAASYEAPVVFFCQNNQWAISVPFSTQSKVPLAQRAAGYGFPGIRVDGNDVLGVYAVTKWAMDRARRGEGPSLIEAETYRIGAHTTADDPTKYRGSDEERAWAAKDPLARFETYLRAQDIADDAFFQDVQVEADQRGAELRSAVQRIEPVRLQAQFELAYAEPHPLIAEELEWFNTYQESFDDEPQNDKHNEVEYPGANK